MKLLVLLSVIAVANAAKLTRGYLPPTHAQISGAGGFLQAPVVVADEAVVQNSPAEVIVDHTPASDVVRIGNQNHANYVNSAQYQEQYVIRSERPQASLERSAEILRQDYQNDGTSYAYAYETENGIYGEENGIATDGVKAQGGYSYTGDDGVQYSIRYVADENGFQPQGDHLPTPHPIPEEILKSLEQNARDEAAGIFDDGSYDESKYGYDDQNQYVVSNFPPQGNVVIANDEHTVNEDTIITNAAPIPRPFFRPGLPGPPPPHSASIHHNLNRVVVNKEYLPPQQIVEVNEEHGVIEDSIVTDAVSTTPRPFFRPDLPGPPAPLGTPIHSGFNRVVINKEYLAPHQVIEANKGNAVIEDTIVSTPRPFFRPGPPGPPAPLGAAIHSTFNRVVVNKAYLPPQQVIEDRSSNVFGRSRKPTSSFNARSGYQY